MLLCCGATTEVSSTATHGPPPLSFALPVLSVSSPSSLPAAPRNVLISIPSHFVQLPYMGELAGMGPVDYAFLPLCLFYLMPKTADNFKSRATNHEIFFLLLLPFASFMYPFPSHVILHSETTC